MQREKVCAVLGLARAGIPAAHFLATRGASVIGYDSKTRGDLSPDALALENEGVELRLGDHGYAGLLDCSLIVLSPGLKIHHEPLFSLLAECEMRGAEIIGELELAARHCPAPMIAVTGTKGKSTTVKLISELLNAAGVKAVRAGNTGVPLIAELSSLTPDSWAIVEVSSFQLEKAPTLKPRIAVLLNLLPDHQDYHTSLDQYWDTKLKLFSHQGAGDTAIFNQDDAATSERVVELTESLLAQGVDVQCTTAQAARQDGKVGLRIDESFVELLPVNDVPLRGEHNLGNLAAALAAVHAALDGRFHEAKEAMAEALLHFESLPHRLEPVGQVNGVAFINDSQATIPDAAIRALESFEPPVTLIAGGFNKLDDPNAYDALGCRIAERAHLLVTIGQAAPILEEAARRGGMPGEKIVSAVHLNKAVEAAIMGTPPGGTVVMSPACASFDQFKNYEERGMKFREAVAGLSDNTLAVET
jgi:UDP-N-acetylmuramoylalanine--D-glutamate ligase